MIWDHLPPLVFLGADNVMSDISSITTKANISVLDLIFSLIFNLLIFLCGFTTPPKCHLELGHTKPKSNSYFLLDYTFEAIDNATLDAKKIT